MANAALQTWATEFYSDRRAFTESHREFFGDGMSDEEIEHVRQEP